jgi:homoserine O-succinyltransferase
MVQFPAINAEPPEPAGAAERSLVIGLVNNMPAPARRSTEQEFRALLEPAAKHHRLRLRCFFLPGTLRPEPHDEPLATLFEPATTLDGMIVTGTEPIAATLEEEPYWPELCHLVDWATENTISTIWSCLAAQVAVLRLDGILRRKLTTKLSGVFECVKVSDHALLADAPGHWKVPHSRLNDLDEYVLAEHGYQILSRAPRVGADCFLKPAGRSLFVMLQGHPEYGAECLLREYRRDIRRFLLGQLPAWPAMPEHYFDQATVEQLSSLPALAVRLPAREVLNRFDAVVAMPPAEWHPPAARLYANWLALLAHRKAAAPAFRLALS